MKIQNKDNQKLLELLEEYNRLVENLNRSNSLNTSYMKDIHGENVKKQVVTEKMNQIENQLQRDIMDFKYASFDLSLDNLKEVTILEQRLQKIHSLKNLLEKERKQLSDTNYSQTLNNHYSNEVNSDQIRQQLRSVVAEIQKQSQENPTLEMKTPDIPSMKEYIIKSKLNPFYSLPPTFKETTIDKYLELFSSYFELKKIILEKLPLVAEEAVSSYLRNPDTLEPVDLSLFHLNLESELDYGKMSIPSSIPKSRNGMNLMIKYNQLYSQVLSGEDLESNLEELKRIQSEDPLLLDVMQPIHSTFYEICNKKLSSKQL